MKRNITKSLSILTLSAAIFIFYAFTGDQNNNLTAKEKAQGWKLLFDGSSTSGWHLYNIQGAFTVWKAKDGELFCDPMDKTGPGDLITDKEYKDFDLKFDWKLPKGGNSGVFVNVLERKDVPTGWASGHHSEIKQKNGKVQFYLNGVLTTTEDFTSKSWAQKVASSHFHAFPEYGKHISGHIALQDWATGIAFRNIKIKEL